MYENLDRLTLFKAFLWGSSAERTAFCLENRGNPCNRYTMLYEITKCIQSTLKRMSY